MLLCDGCDDAYHMFCLDPPLRSIPEGDWYPNLPQPVLFDPELELDCIELHALGCNVRNLTS